MGNARSSTKRITNDKLRKDSLDGMEIVLDQPQEQEGLGCEMFEDSRNKNNRTETRTSDPSMDFSITPAEGYPISESRKSISSRKSAGSRRSSRRLSSEDAADLMTLSISGLDPIEILRLVQECAEEEEKEKAMNDEEARLRKRNLYSKSTGKSSRRRARDTMNSIDV
jgi:hypothetical protein